MDNDNSLNIKIDDVDFQMLKVSGGSFWMGADNGKHQKKTIIKETADEKAMWFWSLLIHYTKEEKKGEKEHIVTETDTKVKNYDKEAENDEKPVRQVNVNDFYLAETPVTQGLWQAVMGNNPSHHKGLDLPVENVSWNDCQRFIEKLNERTGKTFRLPTEAEWEYAARGGTEGHDYKYAGSDNLKDVVKSDQDNKKSEKKGERTYPVIKGTKPNELGLYNMTGNVWEWCDDWYEKYDAPQVKETLSDESSKKRVRKVLRGGGWTNNPVTFRNTYRELAWPATRYYCIGFRLALSVP